MTSNLQGLCSIQLSYEVTELQQYQNIINIVIGETGVEGMIGTQGYTLRELLFQVETK